MSLTDLIHATKAALSSDPAQAQANFRHFLSPYALVPCIRGLLRNCFCNRESVDAAEYLAAHIDKAPPTRPRLLGGAPWVRPGEAGSHHRRGKRLNPTGGAQTLLQAFKATWRCLTGSGGRILFKIARSRRSPAT
jgi:hypothetical protein